MPSLDYFSTNETLCSPALYNVLYLYSGKSGSLQQGFNKNKTQITQYSSFCLSVLNVCQSKEKTLSTQVIPWSSASVLYKELLWMCQGQEEKTEGDSVVAPLVLDSVTEAKNK